jgi:hypothetical protein
MFGKQCLDEEAGTDAISLVFLNLANFWSRFVRQVTSFSFIYMQLADVAG